MRDIIRLLVLKSIQLGKLRPCSIEDVIIKNNIEVKGLPAFFLSLTLSFLME